MAERTRPIRIEFCVTEQERRLIQSKMAQLGTRNMGAYLRKMAIDGYIIKVDYTQQKKLAAAVSCRLSCRCPGLSFGENTRSMPNCSMPCCWGAHSSPRNPAGCRRMGMSM